MKTFSLNALKNQLRLEPLSGDEAVAQAIACKIKFVTRSRIMNNQQGVLELLFRTDSTETREIFTQMITDLIEEIKGVSVDEVEIIREGQSISVGVAYLWDDTNYQLSVGIGSKASNKQGYFA